MHYKSMKCDVSFSIGSISTLFSTWTFLSCMCETFLPVYNSAKIIKINRDFHSYDHKCTATFFLVHSVYRKQDEELSGPRVRDFEEHYQCVTDDNALWNPELRCVCRRQRLLLIIRVTCSWICCDRCTRSVSLINSQRNLAFVPYTLCVKGWSQPLWSQRLV